jgi:hypothetical protein
MQVFFSVVMGLMMVGQVAPNIAEFMSGRVAAARVYEIVDRVTKIDGASDSGAPVSSAEVGGWEGGRVGGWDCNSPSRGSLGAAARS